MAIVNLLPAMAEAPDGMMRTSHKGTAPGVVVKIAVSPEAQAPVKADAGTVKYGVPVAGLSGAKSDRVLPLPTAPERAPETVKADDDVKAIVHWSYTVPRLPNRIEAIVKSPLPTVATLVFDNTGASVEPADRTLATRAEEAD